MDQRTAIPLSHFAEVSFSVELMLMKLEVCGFLSRIRNRMTVNPIANTIAATVPPSKSLPRSSKAAVGASCKLRSNGKKFITSRPFTSGPSGPLAPGIDADLDTAMNPFVPPGVESLG
jgi:hypothetical protein